MMWWQDFHFLRPYWLLALIIPVIIYFKFKNSGKVQSAWQNACDANLLNFLLIRSGDTQKRWTVGVAVLFAAVLVVALAGPAWIKKSNPALSVENPVMILLNMSGDMWRKDVSPSRIVRGKYLIKDLTADLKNTESGLIVYSREPFMITPLTEDASIIDNLLPALEMDIMPENGDRLDRAIDLAVTRMKEALLPAGNLIVITSDVGERFDAALESAAKAADDGFDVNIINVNAQANDKLKMVADKGKGVYLDYNQRLEPLTKKINDITAKEIRQSQNMQTVWEDMGWYFLWIPALLLLKYFRRGILIILAAGIFAAYPAQAHLFQNDNQAALQKFNRKDYAAAAEQFKDIPWKGAAAYRNGDYASAYEYFAQRDDATSLYNQGNALAKGGKIDEAIKKYEEVLKKEPDFADARFNLEYLKKQQQNQQNQQNQNKEEQQKQNQQQKQSETENNQSDNQQQSESDSQQQDTPDNQNNSQDNAGERQNQQNQNNEEQKQQDSGQSGQNNETQKQNDNEQNQMQPQGDEQQKQNGKPREQTETQDDHQGKLRPEEEESREDEKQEQDAVAGAKNDDSSEKQEQMRARMQKFRKIPEDKGGLLRAFIRKEYNKQRYKN